ncbi:zinc-binding alcohol dehydrogenase family protein [Thermobaculum terrenum ATCC BAA-798]|uniref:alcohol dehydrogenase n=1 Tax=Thermobaculum terrenum (strain ATCC BAA-798 / CCMEE 7001 / YNP1) TaxID=525904 RepID=D1CE69_THET1|nr:zinc-dependent alcohol dehydrogenase family protein [Thermobaculum terrenum]ACZ41225.1 zinc-binding alcohol dehydrogenase family protein [Thermobaculum terrenum ATCC BAA-798]
MKAQMLSEQLSIDRRPLKLVEVDEPSIGQKDLLIKVKACGVCHTDLHIVEGDIPLHKRPIVPGHQIVGVVEKVGEAVTRFSPGDRVGVPWLNWACGRCEYCQRGYENLCVNGKFTGWDVDGGYAEYQVTSEDFTYHIPDGYSDLQAAPLLCAGVVGYRALKLAKADNAERVGLYGFGASAHIAIQVLRYWGTRVFVFTRSREHQKLALELGAEWAGTANDDPGVLMQSSIIYAPAGDIIPQALGVLDKGGVLSLAGIYMTPIPQLDYELLRGEKVIVNVTNATRQDAIELLDLAPRVPIRTEIEVYPLEEANDVLLRLKESKINGSAVLQIS